MLPKETSEFIEQKLINVTDKVTVIVLDGKFKETQTANYFSDFLFL